MATFKTSKAVGEDIDINVQTSTGFWKYNHDGSDSSVFDQNDGGQTISVTNINGEFTIISCGSDGTVSGDITQLELIENQLTSFDGTGLSSLTQLYLSDNQLTSFDGTGLSGLTQLNLNINQLTSFDGTGLSSLTGLNLQNNQLTSFDGTGLSSLTELYLYTNPLTTFIGGDMGQITELNFPNWNIITLTSFDGGNMTGLTGLNLQNNQLTSFDGTGLSSLTSLGLGGNQLTSFDGTGLSSLTDLGLQSNQLTSFDGTGLSGLTILSLGDNQLTSSVNNQILNQLNQNGLSGGEFYSSNGRTSASNTDYDNLISLGWSLGGLDLIIPPTFITSKSVGEDIQPFIQTSTGYWKYSHDGVIQGVFENGWQTITVTNANGEFTLISCDESGNVSGEITYLQLSTFYVLGSEESNQLTSFDGTGLSGLTDLYLYNNQLTSFNGTGLSSLTSLNLNDNQLTSFDGTGLSSLTELLLETNQFTSFDGTGLGSLTSLALSYNQLTSFDGTGLSSLTSLHLRDNQLTSLDVTGLSSLIELNLYENPVTPSVNNQILYQLNQNGLSGGYFASINGRTSASNTDYDNLVSLGWGFEFLDLIAVGSGKLRVKGVNSGGGTTTTTTTTTMAPPTSQATNFLIKSVSLAGSTLQALAEFRLANPLVDGYLVTMDDLSDPIYGNGANSLSNSVLSIVNGTSYSIGDTIGINTFNSQPNGTIVKVGPATNVSIIDGFDCEVFTIPNIQGGQNGHTFEFNVYAYNLDSNGSPVYNINDPLTTALVVQQTGAHGKGGQGKKTKGE